MRISAEIVPDAIEIVYEEATSAGGDQMVYSTVFVCGYAGEWRCRLPVLLREHWERSVDRAVDAAMEEYGIPWERVFDLRDDGVFAN